MSSNPAVFSISRTKYQALSLLPAARHKAQPFHANDQRTNNTINNISSELSVVLSIHSTMRPSIACSQINYCARSTYWSHKGEYFLTLHS